MNLKLIALLTAVLLTACAPSVGASAPTATTPTSVEHGRLLFRNKGCATCHINERITGEQSQLGPIGPNLTDYTNDPEFLRRWLTDPPAIKPGTVMPNLRLTETEIEDLIAFLNEPR